MNRQLVKVLTLLFLAMAVLAHEGEEEPASLGAVANSTDAGMTMPGMAMPGMAMPGMEMPGMETPATTSPEASTLPATTMPGMEMPATTSPEASTLPATTMPGMEMPGMEMPATTSPETSTLPATTMPEMAASEMMMMTPYFHFMGASDALWFKTWVPRTSGALAGACIGLILLAVFERFLGGVKGLIEASWSRSMASHATPDNASIHSYSKSLESGTSYLTNTAPGPLIPAFEPMHDLIRGAMMAFQSLIGFFLMLSVMTFNVTFLLSVIIGLGIGEVIFARWARSGANPGCVSSRNPGPIA